MGVGCWFLPQLSGCLNENHVEIISRLDIFLHSLNSLALNDAMVFDVTENLFEFFLDLINFF